MYQEHHDNVIEDNGVFIKLERFNRMRPNHRKCKSVTKQGHSKLHRMINVLVQNSTEQHIAQVD